MEERRRRKIMRATFKASGTSWAKEGADSLRWIRSGLHEDPEEAHEAAAWIEELGPANSDLIGPGDTVQ